MDTKTAVRINCVAGLAAIAAIFAPGIQAQQPIILTTALSPAIINQQYSATLVASGGTAPYVWGLVSGVLPNKIVLDGPSGRITGTPGTPGLYPFLVQVIDANQNSWVASLTLACQAGIVVAGTPPDGTVGKSYTSAVSITGAVSPYAVSVQSGSLPVGLGLNSSTGGITGTPLASGLFYFTLRVVDPTGSQATLTQSIAISPVLVPSVATLPDGITGRSYSAQLPAGALRGSITTSLVSGIMPNGLSVARGPDNSPVAAVFGGTPALAGTFDFVLRMTSETGLTADQSYHLRIRSPLSFSTNLPGGTAGQSYTAGLVSGGFPPYQMIVTSGIAPDGLALPNIQTSPFELNSSDGSVTGVVGQSGVFTFTVRVTDSGSPDIPVTVMSQEVRIILLPQLTAILNAASYAMPGTTGDSALGSLAPGEIVAVFGSVIGPPVLSTFKLDGRGRIPGELSATCVLFDGVAAPILYTSAGQIAAVVPYEVQGNATTKVQVEYNGLMSMPVEYRVAASALGIFTSDGSGTGQVAALNQDGTINSASNPADRGAILVLYSTGEGQTNPGGQTGTLTTGDTLPTPENPVAAFIDGIPCEILYSGETPSAIAGLLQLNVRIPALARSGDVPVFIISGRVASQAGTTVNLSRLPTRM
jgi:uncharacterized protein (TIGR03437 family)